MCQAVNADVHGCVVQIEVAVLVQVILSRSAKGLDPVLVHAFLLLVGQSLVVVVVVIRVGELTRDTSLTFWPVIRRQG